jgi:hypothetical protein
LTTGGTVVKDVKRKTWVTRKNFENMYNNVYKTMVEADVQRSKKRQSSTMLDCLQNINLPGPNMFYLLMRQGAINNGRAGGKTFILPKNDSECGAPTDTTTDLHYPVLPFIL